MKKRDWNRIFLVLAIITVSIGTDQLTKQLARRQFMGQPSRSYLGDTFRLLYVENEGAFLSLGSGLSEGLRYWALTILPVLILLALLLYTLFSKSMNRWQVIAYSFILGGGISNIYDRLLFGRVVDFMNMGIGNLRTGIFNVADMSIMLGLFMMLPYLFKKSPGKKQEAEENAG